MRGEWDSSKGLAKAILHDRRERRKWLARWLMLTMAWFAVGLWAIDGWLAGGVWRFLLWWGACAVMACVLALFALYDALAVIREEKGAGRE